MNDPTLQYSISGNPSGKTLVFVHGWPDSPTLWAAQVRFFEARYCCVVVTLPGYGGANDKRPACDFPGLVQLLLNTVQTAAGPGRRIVLIGHDWGAFFCYLFEQRHAELIECMITLDVGARLKPSSIGHALFLIGYQWWLIAAWAVGFLIPALGDLMARNFARAVHAPRPSHARARMGYLYYFLWRAILFRRSRSFSLDGYSPRVRLLYVFGGAKKYMFHSRGWLRLLRTGNGSVAVNLPGAGHWVMIDQPEAVNVLIQGWIGAASPGAGSVIRKDQYRQMPWKNLKGVTHEIDRVPDQELYHWRLSRANVSANGEFSKFPGYDRLLVIIEGAGVLLNDTELKPLQPLRFKGEQPIECRLVSGEVTDLGLIFDREKVDAQMIYFSSGPGCLDQQPQTWYIFDLDSGDTHKDVPLSTCSVKRGILVSIFTL